MLWAEKSNGRVEEGWGEGLFIYMDGACQMHGAWRPLLTQLPSSQLNSIRPLAGLKSSDIILYFTFHAIQFIDILLTGPLFYKSKKSNGLW